MDSRRALRLACAAVVAAILSPLTEPLPAQEPPADPGASFEEELSVEVVNVDVWVTDRKGRPVTDLARDDFKLLEDGKPVEIRYFDAYGAPGEVRAEGSATAADPAAEVSREPRSLVIYLDDSKLGPAGRRRVLEDLRELLGGGEALADRYMVVLYDGAPKIVQPFTTDRSAVADVLQRLATLPSGGIHVDLERRRAYRRMQEVYEGYQSGFAAERLCPGDPCRCGWDEMLGAAVEYAEWSAGRVRASAGGLSQIATALAGVPGKKFVLYVSDGIDQQPGLDLFHYVAEVCPGQAMQVTPYYTAYDQTLAFHDLVARANSHGVTFFPVEAQGAGTDVDVSEGSSNLRPSTLIRRIRDDNAEIPLSHMALSTGGRAILNANELGPELARVAEDFDSHYSLGFVPAHRGDGRLHRVEVEVAGRGLRVRHREVYWDQPFKERLASRTFGTLLLGTEHDPLGVSVVAEAPRPGPGGCCLVPIQVRIPVAALATAPGDAGARGRVYVVIAGRRADGDLLPLRGQALEIPADRGEAVHPASVVMDLAPGKYELAVGVVDLLASAASYLRHEIEVAPPEGEP